MFIGATQHNIKINLVFTLSELFIDVYTFIEIHALLLWLDIIFEEINTTYGSLH